MEKKQVTKGDKIYVAIIWIFVAFIYIGGTFAYFYAKPVLKFQDCMADKAVSNCEVLNLSFKGYDIWVKEVNMTANNTYNITPVYYCQKASELNGMYYPTDDYETIFFSDEEIESCQG